jgi:hypothetical protein
MKYAISIKGFSQIFAIKVKKMQGVPHRKNLNQSALSGRASFPAVLFVWSASGFGLTILIWPNTPKAKAGHRAVKDN